jgi:transposase/predicted GIY-YIG superfamily endonuclease
MNQKRPFRGRSTLSDVSEEVRQHLPSPIQDYIMSEPTRYIIYRIYNVVNGKSYIGQTIDFKSRKRDHFAKLRSQTHKNKRLQNAYNKYGREAFHIEILEGVTSKQELNEREIYWIAHFNSYKNGYNMSEGAEVNNAQSIVCVWNDTEFHSINAAAVAIGISESSLRERLKKGYTKDADVGRRREKPPKPQKGKRLKVKSPKIVRTDDWRVRSVIWNGVEYQSLKQAAQANGFSSSTLSVYLQKGWRCDTDILFPTTKLVKPVEIDGIVFNSGRDAARYFDVTPSTISSWIRKGIAHLINRN